MTLSRGGKRLCSSYQFWGDVRSGAFSIVGGSGCAEASLRPHYFLVPCVVCGEVSALLVGGQGEAPDHQPQSWPCLLQLGSPDLSGPCPLCPGVMPAVRTTGAKARGAGSREPGGE